MQIVRPPCIGQRRGGAVLYNLAMIEVLCASASHSILAGARYIDSSLLLSPANLRFPPSAECNSGVAELFVFDT